MVVMEISLATKIGRKTSSIKDDSPAKELELKLSNSRKNWYMLLFFRPV